MDEREGVQAPDKWSQQTRALIEAAYVEDLGTTGDITSRLLPATDEDATGRVVVREPGIICGVALGPEICRVFSRRLGQPLEFAACDLADGAEVAAGVCVATLRGPRPAVLSVERTLLNFFGRMSGVATLTRRYVDKARRGNPDVEILDTRKTLPGWRELDKYAVRAGGGHNHRIGLYDAVLIKDNHLAGVPVSRLAPHLTALLSQPTGSPSFVEVEVDNREQLAEVCQVAGVNIVLLDNFPLDEMRAAVELRDARGMRGRLELEASGGVRLDTVAEIAATGVDRISVGALTHSATSLDIALDV